MSQSDSTFEIPNKISFLGMVLGGRPDADDFAQMAASNYRTIIDLRSLRETGVQDDQALVETLGMTSIHIEVAGAGGLTRAAAALLDGVLETCEGRVVIHCASGNRVGALLALRAYWMQGISKDAAIALGVEAGLTKLEPVVRQILDSDSPVDGTVQAATPLQSPDAGARR